MNRAQVATVAVSAIVAMGSGVAAHAATETHKATAVRRVTDRIGVPRQRQIERQQAATRKTVQIPRDLTWDGRYWKYGKTPALCFFAVNLTGRYLVYTPTTTLRPTVVAPGMTISYCAQPIH